MGYNGNVESYNNNCCYSNSGGVGFGSAFALLVVLFILLIIVGATFMC